MTEEESRKTPPVSLTGEERRNMVPSVIAEQTLDLEAVLERVGGDRDLLREIASIFLEEFPSLMDAIRTAVAGADAFRLERAAHSLKGSVANFGAPGATAAALALEIIGRQNRMGESADALARLEAEFSAILPSLEQVVRGEF